MVNTEENKTSCTMTKIIKRQSGYTLLTDLIGALALLAMLYTALWLPTFL